MSSPRQYVLPLPLPIASGRADFFVSDANRPALEAIERWPDWHNGMLALIGPAGSGKSHLVDVHRARLAARGEPLASWPATDAVHVVVEKADTVVGTPESDEALFHTFNRAQAERGSLLFTARTPLASWPVRLPDLRTRLNTVVTADLTEPDDALLRAVLLKLFADRQTAPDRANETTEWLLPRMERSLAAATEIIAAIDAAALARHQPIGPRVAADILKARGQA